MRGPYKRREFSLPTAKPAKVEHKLSDLHDGQLDVIDRAGLGLSVGHAIWHSVRTGSELPSFERLGRPFVPKGK